MSENKNALTSKQLCLKTQRNLPSYSEYFLKKHKDYSMFRWGVLLAAFVLLDVAISAPIEEEKIDPVDLSYYCVYMKEGGNKPDKSPILLIHGLGSSQNNWDGIHQVLAIQTQRRVCSIDLRNHGDSPWNNRTDVEAMTVDIGHFLDKNKIQKVNIIGHSLGGKVGVHYTLNNPDRVDSLVVEDMRPNGVTPKGLLIVQGILKYLQESVESIKEGSNEEEAKKAIAKFLNEKLNEIGYTENIDENGAKLFVIRLVNGKWQWKMNLDLLQKVFNNLGDNLIGSNGLFNGPTLFIYGTASIFDVAGDEQNIMKLFPNAKLIPVEGAGHVIHGRYKKFEDEVIKFLNQIDH